jgi:DNA-nicking Smr family endonuclease
MKRSKGQGDMGDEDAALWEKVTRQAEPLSKAQRAHGLAKTPDNDKLAQATGSKKPPKPTKQNKQSSAAAVSAGARPAAKTPRDGRWAGAAHTPQEEIEAKARRRLGRGHIEIEGRLDLHGMTAVEAKAALTAFINGSVMQKKTWVLVITGKGTAGQGVLRRELPLWCAQAPLSQQIIEFGPASPAHGGVGATYMRLRKQRG